jgi:hypothetical protein
MAEVQISINDVLAAFANENSALVQRAVLAEQKSKAWQARAEELEKALAEMWDERTQAAQEKDTVPEVDPPVVAVKRAAARKR